MGRAASLVLDDDLRGSNKQSCDYEFFDPGAGSGNLMAVATSLRPGFQCYEQQQSAVLVRVIQRLTTPSATAPEPALLAAQHPRSVIPPSRITLVIAWVAASAWANTAGNCSFKHYFSSNTAKNNGGAIYSSARNAVTNAASTIR